MLLAVAIIVGTLAAVLTHQLIREVPEPEDDVIWMQRR
jgi:hypothetical protein